MVEPTNRRILVLDAELRHSLEIVRSLGRQGLPVVAASNHSRFTTRYSRHVEGIAVTAPGTGHLALQSLIEIIERERIGVVIPGGLLGNELLCRHRCALEQLVRAPFNDLSEFDRLSNKRLTIELAQSLEVPYPKTEELPGPDAAADVAAQIGFPMVFKSPVDQGTVRYPRDVEGLRRLVAEFADEHPELAGRGIVPLAQEYVEGDGHGFYGLADHGHVRAYFMHRRVHEVPPTGGPSAMAMSFRDPQLFELGRRFFSATSWNGAAMVEFKRRRQDGRYFLLEVNPKFWGSLGLSIGAGVDFPFLLYEMLVGDSPEFRPGVYRDEMIFRSLTMDLAYAVATRRVRSYVRSFADRRIVDDFDRSDPLPTAAQFLFGFLRWSAQATGGSRRPTLASGRFALGPIALRAFYLAKPMIPRVVQVAARRGRARWIWNRIGRDCTIRIPGEPTSYPWPDAVRACVLVTHDIETAAGQRNVEALLNIEEEYGVHSCWNFVVRRYPVDTSLVSHLRHSGHEIGLHGVYHDGKEFDSALRFRERLGVLQEAGRAWGAAGFRSPSLLYDRALLSTLPFDWDSSMPAWDPFQPKRGDCYRYVPFALNDRCIELPVTLWQDFTLFEELQMRDIDVWRNQADRIYAAGGLINVIVHPDYMLAPRRLDLYRALLDHLAAKDAVWIATPTDVAEWERARPRS